MTLYRMAVRCVNTLISGQIVKKCIKNRKNSAMRIDEHKKTSIFLDSGAGIAHSVWCAAY